MRVEHLAISVVDIEGAKEFFEKYFGAKANNLYHNEKTGFKSYFLCFEDGARLEIMNKPDVVIQDEKNYFHMAFGVGSREAVDALTSKLQVDGYKVVSGPRITGDGYYESCIVGYEGYLIEITV